jgi:20S proteasome alpha/beta subunit
VVCPIPQAVICDPFDKGKRVVTFQLAMVCQDGIIVASDSRVSYFTPAHGDEPSASQFSQESKFIASPNRKVICTFAGSAQAEPTASAIARMSETFTFGSEVEWRCDLRAAADSCRRGAKDSPLLDEVIVCRSDTNDCFWLVSKFLDCPANLRRITSYVCTGDNSTARFLPRYLYKPHLSLEEGKRLALLTLGLASKENPSNISEPFELIVVSRNEIPAAESFSMERIKPWMAEFDTQLKSAFWR